MLIHPSHNLSKCQAILSNDGFNFIMNLIALHALTSNTITNTFIYYSVFSENSQGEQTENAPEGNPKRHWNSLNLNEFQCLFCLIKSPLIRTIVVSVTMYYSHPCRLAKSLMAKQNCSHRANVICDGSPSRMRRVRRISFGMTTRPRSSMRRTMPVAFISKSPLSVKYYKAIVCRRREIMHELAFAQIASLRYNRNTKIFAKKEKVGKRDGGWL